MTTRRGDTGSDFLSAARGVRGKPAVRSQKVVTLQDSGRPAIFLVDEEAAARLAVAELLRSVGHDVLESRSALDAVEPARHAAESTSCERML